MTITENPPKATIETCNHWDTDYISDNREQHSEHSIKSDNEQHFQFLRSLSCAYHSCFCSVSCPFWCFVFSGAVCDSLPNSSQCAQTRWPRLVPPLNLTMECLAAHSRPPRRSQRYSPRFGQESALMVRVNNQTYIGLPPLHLFSNKKIGPSCSDHPSIVSLTVKNIFDNFPTVHILPEQILIAL